MKCELSLRSCLPVVKTSSYFSPLYFPDIIVLLRGMNCEEFIDHFALANVSLEEFLTITDERLNEIGIKFPFQRNMIKVGLHMFHTAAWSRSSLFIPEKFEEGFSDVDLVMMLANIHRQLVLAKSHMHFLYRLGSPRIMKPVFEYFSPKYMDEFKSLTKQLEKRLKAIIRQNPQSRPLLIKKKTNKSISLTKLVAFAAIPIVIVGVVKHFKI